MISLLCAGINGWVNNGEAGDLRRHRAHYDATVMWCIYPWFTSGLTDTNEVTLWVREKSTDIKLQQNTKTSNFWAHFCKVLYFKYCNVFVTNLRINIIRVVPSLMMFHAEIILIINACSKVTPLIIFSHICREEKFYVSLNLTLDIVMSYRPDYSMYKNPPVIL